MRQVFQTFLFQLVSIVLFGVIYWVYGDEFSLKVRTKKRNNLTLLDCFFTSVTLQAGVGYSILNPDTDRAVSLLMVQQILMVFSNILILYLFSMHLLSKRK
jgi:hypothetical protein